MCRCMCMDYWTRGVHSYYPLLCRVILNAVDSVISPRCFCVGRASTFQDLAFSRSFNLVGHQATDLLCMCVESTVH